MAQFYSTILIIFLWCYAILSKQHSNLMEKFSSSQHSSTLLFPLSKNYNEIFDWKSPICFIFIFLFFLTTDQNVFSCILVPSDFTSVEDIISFSFNQNFLWLKSRFLLFLLVYENHIFPYAFNMKNAITYSWTWFTEMYPMTPLFRTQGTAVNM